MEYITDSKLTELDDRTHNLDEEKEWIRKTFLTGKVCKKYCGNVQVGFNKKGRARLCEDRNEHEIASYAQISSALALYRAVSLFHLESLDQGADYYKVNWSITLEHAPTGTFLILGEWKGAFGIFTPATRIEQLPKEFITDVERFLTAFVSVDLTIDYDGTRSGGVA